MALWSLLCRYHPLVLPDVLYCAVLPGVLYYAVLSVVLYYVVLPDVMHCAVLCRCNIVLREQWLQPGWLLDSVAGWQVKDAVAVTCLLGSGSCQPGSGSGPSRVVQQLGMSDAVQIQNTIHIYTHTECTQIHTNSLYCRALTSILPCPHLNTAMPSPQYGRALTSILPCPHLNTAVPSPQYGRSLTSIRPCPHLNTALTSILPCPHLNTAVPSPQYCRALTSLQGLHSHLRKLLNMLQFAWQQARGQPTGPHAAFKEYFVDAATLRLSLQVGRGGVYLGVYRHVCGVQLRDSKVSGGGGAEGEVGGSRVCLRRTGCLQGGGKGGLGGGQGVFWGGAEGEEGSGRSRSFIWERWVSSTHQTGGEPDLGPAEHTCMMACTRAHAHKRLPLALPP